MSKSIREPLALILMILITLLAGWGEAQENIIDPKVKFETLKNEVEQATNLAARAASDSAVLDQLQEKIEPLFPALYGLVGDMEKRLESAQNLLKQLPAKSEDETIETPELRAEREILSKSATEWDGFVKRSKALEVQTQQLRDQLKERRRQNFTSALFARTAHPLSGAFWNGLLNNLASEAKSLSLLWTDWLSALENRIKNMNAIIGLASAIFAIILGAVIRRTLMLKDPRKTQSAPQNRWQSASTALRFVAAPAIVMPIGMIVAVNILEALGFLPGRMAQLSLSIVLAYGAYRIFAVLADILFATARPWRLVNISDIRSEFFNASSDQSGLLAATIVMIPALTTAAVASLQTATFLGAIISIYAGIFFIHKARSLPQETPEADCLGPEIPARPDRLAPVKTLFSVLGLLILGATLTGYIAFALFLTKQILWIIAISGTVAFASILMEELVTTGLSPQNKLGRQLLASTGLSSGALAQTSILTSGLLKVILLATAGILIAAPWGLRSDDLSSWLLSAATGVQIGPVRLSFSAIALAIILFLLAMAATRAVQRWLEKRYLPATSLDMSLRNSLLTVLGYLGFALAAMLASSTLGLNLENVALVAGALSVGIGFGLQSIINNFVSGLILLWERPIKVGDWIVVKDNEGYVRRINVRSTIIETFDKAHIIVPNGDLISSSVKNWMHGDRSARTGLTFTFAHGMDAEKIRETLVSVAAAQPDVQKEPKPTAVFKAMNDQGFLFDIRFTVRDADIGARVKSDMLFAFEAEFKKAGLRLAGQPAELFESL
jgi:potassium-dependent mechanosensitive channel